MKLMIAMYLTALFAAVMSQTANADKAFDDNKVFGVDNRKGVYGAADPLAAVGRLETQVGNSISSCTGTLVAPDLVLTASHCVTEEGTGAPLYPVFYPLMIRGEALTAAGTIRMWRGTSDPRTDSAGDWAILQIDRPLGNTYGFMGVTTEEVNNVSLAGYSGDFEQGKTMSTHLGCNIYQRFENGRFHHDCDSTSGSSGGPVFKLVSVGGRLRGQIVGVHTRQSAGGDWAPVADANNYNAGTSSKNFLGTLQEILANR